MVTRGWGLLPGDEAMSIVGVVLVVGGGLVGLYFLLALVVWAFRRKRGEEQ